MTRGVCPCCGARVGRAALLRARRARRVRCPVCGAQALALVSRPRAAGLVLALGAACALDAALLAAQAPFACVLFLAAAAAAAVWHFRAAAVVLVPPAPQREETRL